MKDWQVKDKLLHTCAVPSHGKDRTFADKVNQLLLGADCRINSYGIRPLGRDFFEFLEVWLNQKTLLTAWTAQSNSCC